MRFVAVKTEEQQSTLVIHRVRETLVAQKTQLINALRAHLAEFHTVASRGAGKGQRTEPLHTRDMSASGHDRSITKCA